MDLQHVYLLLLLLLLMFLVDDEGRLNIVEPIGIFFIHILQHSIS